ncbi:MAG: metallophosphoesterase family protein [Bacteroidia bacterium]|nr:metallophosphoesterase family protein [Bacteroidia bacterium]
MSRLIAIADIHGCYKPFYELVVKTIDLKKADRLILLGDYIDRGMQSKEVIDFIIDLKEKGFDIIPLAGNHEAMLLDSYTDPAMLYLWIMNSGETTLQSFGVLNVQDIEKGYIDFFSGLKYYESTGNYLFVHAGFNDGDADPFSDTNHMIWESRLSYENPVLWGKTIIHGHRPKTLDFVKKQIDKRTGVIPIDTGCVYGLEMGYGFLSALDVNGMKLYSVPNN